MNKGNNGNKEIKEFKREMLGYYNAFLDGDMDDFNDWFGTLYGYLKRDRLVVRKDDKTILIRM